LFEETLYQTAADGTPFVKVLDKNGIIPGIKVDTGLKPLCGGGEGEKWCSGLDGLYEKCKSHRQHRIVNGERTSCCCSCLRYTSEKHLGFDAL